MGGNWKKWGWDWWWSGCWEKGCTSQAAIAQIKAGHVRIIAITVQFMFVHHYFKIFVNLLATPWKLPPCSSKLWEVVATWLVVNPIWLSASKTSRRVGIGPQWIGWQWRQQSRFAAGSLPAARAASPVRFVCFLCLSFGKVLLCQRHTVWLLICLFSSC